MKTIEIKEVAIYDNNHLIIGYELQKYKLDKDGIFKIVETKRVIF